MVRSFLGKDFINATANCLVCFSFPTRTHYSSFFSVRIWKLNKSQAVPSTPKIHQSRPLAVTSPHQMMQMQTMIPRPIISTPHGFRKPSHMTQATVSLTLDVTSKIHQLFFPNSSFSTVTAAGCSRIQANSPRNRKSKRQCFKNANSIPAQISRIIILPTSKTSDTFERFFFSLKKHLAPINTNHLNRILTRTLNLKLLSFEIISIDFLFVGQWHDNPIDAEPSWKSAVSILLGNANLEFEDI